MAGDRVRSRRGERGACGEGAGRAGDDLRAGVPGDGSIPSLRPGRRRRHPLLRRLRRLAAAFCALVFLGMVAFAGLLLVTPSAGRAPALARAQDMAHHAAWPGAPVPPRFAAALIATEDHRFYSEPGIDLFAVARVGWSYLSGQGDQGGATLYQQLAKVLYTPGRTGPAAEAEQVALAVKLYLTFTPAQVLRMYSSVVYFGNGYYGLSAASCGYFGVPPRAMSWPQAALLAGLVQAPSLDDPLRYPANARAREEHVFARLVATGKLSPAAARAALAVPVARLTGRAGTGCAAPA
jgi:membrane peptidoglycan carboxypeptidase